MEQIWISLGLEPTRDMAAIRRAYAQKSRDCHPEEDPEGFLQLRKAYQAALDYAEGKTGEVPGPAAEEPEDQGWDFSPRQVPREEGPNPYEDHEAVRAFLELYTGKQRKDSKRWLDYFTSDAFLDVAWERRFAALLLELVTRMEGEYPVPREMLMWLCAAYQFTVIKSEYRNPDGSERIEFRFQEDAGSVFEGKESVFQIATKGPLPKGTKAEMAIRSSFRDYRRLAALAEGEIWNETDLQTAGKVLDYYMIGNFSDKNPAETERHPVGMRLIAHFFRREGLPDELYRIAWQKLELQTAIMGRTKLLYGPLRERVLERLPELAGKRREDYTRLRADFRDYAVLTYKESGENAQATEEDIRATDALFAREDFQKALLDRRFVEEDMLHTSVSETRCDYYLKRVIQFYTEHETAPYAQRVIEWAKHMQKLQTLADRLKRDRKEVPEWAMSLKSSAFFRHWINTGFYLARDPETGSWLLDYLSRELPFLPDWGKKFLEVKGEEIIPRSFTFRLDGHIAEVRFHLRYMEFWVDQTPVYRQCLAWEQLIRERDTDAFFFLLPIAATTYDQYDAVRAELLRRLEDTAAPEDGRAVIAGCLAGWVCSLPLPGEVLLAEEDEEEGLDPVSLPPESVLPFEVFAENADHLYGCAWFEQSQSLLVFEQWSDGRQLLKDGRYEDVPDAQAAVTLAKQCLEEIFSPTPFPLDQLAILPDAVYACPDFGVVCRDKDAPLHWSRHAKLLGEGVAAEALEELLERFSNGKIERMEWSWNTTLPAGEEGSSPPLRSLVLMKGNGGYACLCFDDARAESYALLAKPERYGKEKGSAQLVPFRRGKLFQDCIHRSFTSIRRQLGEVFRQVSRNLVRGNLASLRKGGIWDWAVNVTHGRPKYYQDKQLLADFPMERAHSRPDAPLYFSCYPDSAAGAAVLGITETNRDRLQQLLIGFFQGGMPKLRLTWGREEGRRRHIVLLRDGERFLMAWILEEKRSVRFHVADVWTYMDVEGKKYPKDTFLGRTTPAYLIHKGVTPLRNALEMLLANLENPNSVTDKMAEYAEEKPVKARPYETIWAELVGDSSV